MALNEYQKKWLAASGQADHIDFLEGRPDISDVIVPKTPEAQAFKHQLGGASNALGVVKELQNGDVAAAQACLDQLREQARESSRGVAKDALPMLQAHRVIDEMFDGSISRIGQELLTQALQALDQQMREGLAGWHKEQSRG